MPMEKNIITGNFLTEFISITCDIDHINHTKANNFIKRLQLTAMTKNKTAIAYVLHPTTNFIYGYSITNTK